MLQTEKFKLFQELNQVHRQVDLQIAEVHALSQTMGVAPELIKTGNGEFMLTPLLLAKSNVLLAKVNLHKE